MTFKQPPSPFSQAAMPQSGQNLIVVDIFAFFDQSGSVNYFKPGWRPTTLGQLAMGREIHNGGFLTMPHNGKFSRKIELRHL